MEITRQKAQAFLDLLGININARVKLNHDEKNNPTMLIKDVMAAFLEDEACEGKKSATSENILPIAVINKRFTFDCWYCGDGKPLKRYIEAENEDKAAEIFKETYPDMEHDYPYE
jgi:methanogenic corrinoid protein MtbC1